MKRVIFINLIIVSLLFIILELSLRLILDVRPLGIAEGIINEENEKIRFNYENVKGKKIFGTPIFTDQNGFRIVKNYKPKNDNIKKIFFIGGSVTFGSGVDQEFTFSGLLNSKLQNYNIFNASVMGSDLKNNYNILKKITTEDNIDKIFINFSFDDIQKTKIDKSFVEGKKQTFLVDDLKNYNILKNINAFLRSKSVIYVFIKGFLFDTRNVYYFNALKSYSNKNNLMLIDQEFKKIKKINNNTEIFFLKIPYFTQVSIENCKKNDIGELKIMEKMKKYNFKLIDFKPIFCSYNSREKIYLTFDPSHLSPFGHKLVANYLNEFFIK